MEGVARCVVDGYTNSAKGIRAPHTRARHAHSVRSAAAMRRHAYAACDRGRYGSLGLFSVRQNVRGLTVGCRRR